MIKKFNRLEPEYRNSVLRFSEFLFGEYLLYLSLWNAYDPVEDEFNYRRTFWFTLLTIFTIIFLATIFITCIYVIANL